MAQLQRALFILVLAVLPALAQWEVVSGGFARESSTFANISSLGDSTITTTASLLKVVDATGKDVVTLKSDDSVLGGRRLPTRGFKLSSDKKTLVLASQCAETSGILSNCQLLALNLVTGSLSEVVKRNGPTVQFADVHGKVLDWTPYNLSSEVATEDGKVFYTVIGFRSSNVGFRGMFRVEGSKISPIPDLNDSRLGINRSLGGAHGFWRGKVLYTVTNNDGTIDVLSLDPVTLASTLFFKGGSTLAKETFQKPVPYLDITSGMLNLVSFSNPMMTATFDSGELVFPPSPQDGNTGTILDVNAGFAGAIVSTPTRYSVVVGERGSRYTALTSDDIVGGRSVGPMGTLAVHRCVGLVNSYAISEQRYVPDRLIHSRPVTVNSVKELGGITAFEGCNLALDGTPDPQIFAGFTQLTIRRREHLPNGYDRIEVTTPLTGGAVAMTFGNRQYSFPEFIVGNPTAQASIVSVSTLMYQPQKGLAPGSLAVIRGRNLTGFSTSSGVPLGPNIASGTPWPTRLAGAEVLIGTTLAPILYAITGPDRVSTVIFQVPTTMVPREQTYPLVVRVFDNQPPIGGNLVSESSLVALKVVPTSPTISRDFRDTQKFPLIIVNKSRGGLVSQDNPAHPGDVLEMWGTGFGLTNPVVPSGSAGYGEVITPVKVFLKYSDGLYWQMENLYNVSSPEFPGTYQLAFRIPSDARTENAQILFQAGEDITESIVVLDGETIHDILYLSN